MNTRSYCPYLIHTTIYLQSYNRPTPSPSVLGREGPSTATTAMKCIWMRVCGEGGLSLIYYYYLISKFCIFLPCPCLDLDPRTSPNVKHGIIQGYSVSPGMIPGDYRAFPVHIDDKTRKDAIKKVSQILMRMHSSYIKLTSMHPTRNSAPSK